MSISFDTNLNSRIPFTYVEFGNSNAMTTSSLQPYKVLLIGQKTDGLGAPLKPLPVSSEKEVAKLFGSGSMIHCMAKSYFANSDRVKTYAIALNDADNSSPASWTVSRSGGYSQAVSLPLFIDGRKIEAVVSDKAGNPLEVLEKKINELKDLPVTALFTKAVEGSDHTQSVVESLLITCKNKGAQAGSIDVRTEYCSYKQPENGLKLVLGDHKSGQGDPSLEEMLKDIKNKQFNIIANPYTDDTNLPLIEHDLAERFSPLKQIEGHLISAFSGDKAKVVTFAGKRASPHVTVIAAGPSSPTSSHRWAAALAGVVAVYGQQDPARPFNTLPINDVLPDEDEKRFSRSENSEILDVGISTHAVDFSGQVRVQRLITTYKGVSETDESYLAINTLLTLSRLFRFSFPNYFAAKYPRHKLADDDAFVPPGAPIITPSVARAEAISLFRSWEEEGYVENFDKFKDGLIVERHKFDRGRLDFYMTPQLVSQLNIIGAKVDFLI